MKIVYIVSQFPSLTETFIVREIQKIVDAGHDVTVCILRAQAATHGPPGIQVQARKIRMQGSPFPLIWAQFLTFFRHPLSYLKAFSEAITYAARQPGRGHQVLYIFFASAWFANRLRNQGAQYIHSHFLHSESITAKWLAGFLKVPYGITAHVASIRHDRKLIRNVITNAQVLVGDTSQTLAVYRQLTARPANLIRNGIDLGQFEPLRISEPAGRPAPLILSVGSLLHPKGHHILIQACSILKQKGIAFTCKIIGEGAERPVLEKLIRTCDLTGVVELAGALSFSQLREQYARASMLVMASIPSPAGSDGLPTVLIEAMALGIPVIGTNHAGLPDLITPHQTGLLVEPGNPDELARAIEELMVDDCLRAKCIQNGRLLIEREFDINRNVPALLDLIDHAILGVPSKYEELRK